MYKTVEQIEPVPSSISVTPDALLCLRNKPGKSRRRLFRELVEILFNGWDFKLPGGATPTVPVDTRVSHCSATGMGLIEVVWVTKAVDLDYSGKVTSSLDWAKILGEWVLQVTGLTLDKGREQVYPNPRNLARHSVRRVGIPLSVWRSAVSEPQSNPLPARHRGTSFGGRTVTSDLRLWAITD